MFRPQDGRLIETPSNWSTFNPIIPFGVFAINSDGSGVKTGNGVDKWNDLIYLGAGSIRGKSVQSNREPLNNELLVFCESQDKWVFRLQGCSDTSTNWASNTSVFPTHALLTEVDDSTSIPTGRFKIGDGVNQFDTLPWFGADFNKAAYSNGESVEFNGTDFEPATYLHPDDLQSATSPSGKFHRDDGTWANVSDSYVSGDTSSTANHIAIFDDTTGKSIADSGVDITTLPSATGSVGDVWQIHNGVGPKLTNVSGDLKVYKDNGTTLGNVTVADLYANYGVFPTVLVGSPATEATSVTLTSDGTYLYVDGGKLIDVNHDGHGSGLDADTVDGKHATEFATTLHTQTASTVTLTNKSGATYTTLQHWANAIQSSGRVSGGVITAHSPADGTVDISALTGFIKLTDSVIGEVEFFDQPASTSLALTDDATNYIYVTYNGGNPQILVTTDRSTIRYTDQFNLGRAFRNGNDVEVLNSGVNLYNRTRLIHEKWIDTFGGVSYANGLTVSCTGLKPAFTAGTLYAGSNKISINALDCNTSGTFDAYYTTDNGTTWTIQTGQTTLSNTQYNDVSTGLATLSNNQYGVHWLYVCPEGEMYVLYGKSSYTLAGAQAATGPVSPIPNYLAQWAKLAAKIIILKSATSVYSITSAWSTAFPVQSVGSHNDLTSLQGGTTDQYYHLTSTQHTTLTGNTFCRWRGSSATDPTDPLGGDIYYNSGDSKTYIYNGSTWDALN